MASIEGDLMRKLILGLAALTMVAAACQPGAGEPEATFGATLTCPWDQSDPTMRTFIVAGQSNMVAANGNPGTLPTAYEAGTNAQLQMWDEGEWKPLALSTENKKDKLKYGPDLPFAWTLHAACPDSNIGIIKYAVGGTAIERWVPSGDLGQELSARAQAAYFSHPDVTIEGFLFQQGGGDTQTREEAESWDEDYLSIVDFARNTPGVANDLPFLHGTYRFDPFPDDFSALDPDDYIGMAPGGRDFFFHMLVSQWTVQYDRPGIYPVIHRDLPLKDDGIHWNSDGIRLAGQNFAVAYTNEAN